MMIPMRRAQTGKSHMISSMKKDFRQENTSETP